jgi:hypothetical protein
LVKTIKYYPLTLIIFLLPDLIYKIYYFLDRNDDIEKILLLIYVFMIGIYGFINFIVYSFTKEVSQEIKKLF